MKRFGVSLEEELLEELDGLVKKNKLPNRSQAIRYLIRKSVTTEQWETNQVVSGCVVLVYDHHKRDLLTKAVNIQHDYQNIVLSSQHVHLDHDNCIETIILKGKARDLKELADRLIGLKGIKHGQLVMSTTG
ncbi:MAG: nickel-responsive transcriptional regulator NikR [Candidatus Aadella gelida]|nr:nickel-responsive transcriptional regulator NikR [Candidatus Aadella gelida]